MHRLVTALSCLSLVVACTGATPGPAATASPSAEASPSTSGWAADVDVLVAQLETVHPDPFHSISRAEFLQEVAAYERQLPAMTEWEAVTGFQRLVALLTRDGRDGHMVLRPSDRPGLPWRMLPVQLYLFDDGLYVVAGKGEARDLVGAKVVQFGDTDAGEATSRVRELISKDNDMTVASRIPAFLEAVDLLGALGVLDTANPSLTLSVGGELVTRAFEPIPHEEHEAWRTPLHPYARRLPPRGSALYFTRQDDSVWTRYLGRSRSLYVSFNLVMPPFGPVVDEIESILRTRPTERVIIDLRHNPGGETGTYGPLLDAVTSAAAGGRRGVFALTSRTTFSAAANFLADLDNEVCTVIVGEPPGAAPRFWNDNDGVPLPYSGLEIGVATRWWGKGGKRHDGTTFEVDIPVPYRSRDYFTGGDPVLHAAETARATRCS